MNRARLSLLVIGLTAALPACASSSDPMVLGLNYRPTSQIDPAKSQGLMPIAASSRVWINPVIDVHPEGSQIGISQEEDNSPVYFGAQGLPPADFVRAALVQILPFYGVPVAPDPNSRTHVLELRMTRFWTVEGNVYHSTITATAVLADAVGNVVWQGEITGMNKRWGRTFQAESYVSVFSDAALEFSQTLAINPGFRAGVNTATGG